MTEGMQGLICDWKHYLLNEKDNAAADFQKHERTAPLLGDENFLETMEKLLNRDLKKKKPGPKPKDLN